MRRGLINPHAHAKPPPGYTTQKVAFCIWAALCLFLTLAALRNTTLEQYETFHIYYQPLIILVAMLWLWAGNVRYFEWRNMRYDLCFSAADQRFLLSSRQILQVCGSSARFVPAVSARNFEQQAEPGAPSPGMPLSGCHCRLRIRFEVEVCLCQPRAESVLK